jgi:hypothetical protein
MRIRDWGHVPESALADVADDDAARQRLSPSERRHLDACDRCLGLLEGHRRTTALFAATWQFIAADQPATEHGVQRVHGVVSAAGVGPVRFWRPAWIVLALLLLAALVGAGLLVGARPPSDPRLTDVISSASPSPAAASTARPTPDDTSSWLTLRSEHYGLQMSRPPGWQVTPATRRRDLIVDQNLTFFIASTDRLTAPVGDARFAAYGMTIPDGIPADGFIEAYRAPNLARQGIDCFPPRSTWQQLPLDGYIAEIADGCGYLEAIVLVERRIYIFSGYGSLAEDRHLFEALLSTVRLLPETVDDGPFPASSSSN